MEERDLRFVARIERLSFTHPWPESSFRGEVQNRHISYPSVIIHRPDDRLIGYVIFWCLAEEAQISNFALHPDYRGMGVGENILRLTLRSIQNMGARHVVLEVRPSNTAARTLYRKLQFIPLGLRKGYYRDPEEDALVMIKYFHLPEKNQ